MPDESSSSASVKSICITSCEETPSGVLKLTAKDGVFFFTRKEYLDFNIEKINISLETPLSDEKLELLYLAIRSYSAELQALNYLSRREHSRFLLEQKLQKKKFSPLEFKKALDFLEKMGYLNDTRFAFSWLRARIRTNFEGKTKLKAGLYARGVSPNIANIVLEEFFTEDDEFNLCKKALTRQRRLGFTDEKLLRSLQRKGFSFYTIQQCLKDEE